MIRCLRRRVTIVLGSFTIILTSLQSSWFTTRGCSSIICNSGEQDQQIDNEQGEQQLTRLVIFAGPHKGASTSVESFFFSVFKNQQTIPEPFVNWSMPMLSEDLPWYTPITPNPKQYTYALRELGKNEQLNLAILHLIAHEYEGNKSVLLCAESFGAKSNRIGDTFIRSASFSNLMPVDIVLNYRTARVDHLISNWKQDRDEKGAPSNFHKWLCSNKYVDNLQDGKGLDVFGRAQLFLDEGWRVILVDLGGVERDNLDVSHVIACNVLRVPCSENGVIQGFNTSKQQSKDKTGKQNQREGDTNITLHQYNGLDTILRQRDCLYAASFKEAKSRGQMHFLHQLTLLQGCSSDDKYQVDSPALQKSLLSNEGILQLLRDQVGGCQLFS